MIKTVLTDTFVNYINCKRSETFKISSPHTKYKVKRTSSTGFFFKESEQTILLNKIDTNLKLEKVDAIK